MKFICSKCGYTGDGPDFPHHRNIDGSDCAYIARRAPEFAVGDDKAVYDSIAANYRTTNTPEASRLAEEEERKVAERAFNSDPCNAGYSSYIDLYVDGWLARAKQDAAPTSAATGKRDLQVATSASTVPAGFWLAPMEPDEEMWTDGRDPIMYRDLGDYRPASLDVPAWQRELDGSVNHDKSKGTAAVRVWRAMRDSWLARNPGDCSVTDGEAKNG